MTDWKPYYDLNTTFSTSSDLPRNHEWIEIKSLGEETGRVIRPSELHPAMAVVDLYWRPAQPPAQAQPTPLKQELDIALAQALEKVAQLEKEKQILITVLHGTTTLIELVVEYATQEKRPNE